MSDLSVKDMFPLSLSPDLRERVKALRAETQAKATDYKNHEIMRRQYSIEVGAYTKVLALLAVQRSEPCGHTKAAMSGGECMDCVQGVPSEPAASGSLEQPYDYQASLEQPSALKYIPSTTTPSPVPAWDETHAPSRKLNTIEDLADLLDRKRLMEELEKLRDKISKGFLSHQAIMAKIDALLSHGTGQKP